MKLIDLHAFAILLILFLTLGHAGVHAINAEASANQKMIKEYKAELHARQIKEKP